MAVVSATGIYIGDNPNTSRGALKVSPNGKKLLAAHARMQFLDCSEFNNQTGAFTHSFRIAGAPPTCKHLA